MSDWFWVLWCILGAILSSRIFSRLDLCCSGLGLARWRRRLGFSRVDSLAIQFMIFAVVSVGLTAASRTIFINYFSRDKSEPSLRMGVESMPGKIGTVVSSSKGALNEGAVKVFGSTLSAYPAPGEPPLEAGERVCVESVSASIYVANRR